MGLPLYKSSSSEALRRQAEGQSAAQAVARQVQASTDSRRARSGAPPPLFRRENTQRRAFSGSSSVASMGTQQRPIDLTRPSLEVEAPSQRRPVQRRPASPTRRDAPIPSTENLEMEDIDDAASAPLSRYSRTRFDNSELATPAEEEEIRLPNYGTPDVEWSTPEIEAASTPPRAAWSSPAAPPPAPAPAVQPRHRQQIQAGPSQARRTQDDRHLVAGRSGFVELVVDQNRGPAVHVQGSGRVQTIPPALRLPPLPRPSDATIRDPRRRGLRLLDQGSSSRQSGGSSGNQSSSDRSS
ncbi:hypothetical protein B0T09DRAFT_372619 [Sordaria sp. MPI-SDFR-AT-0083]|nr:hypothetical protein B0T09DRAFT_372619 [Sordaria sp. MPI-SDFR-AT-0083]